MWKISCCVGSVRKKIMQWEIHFCLWVRTCNLLLTNYNNYCDRNQQLRSEVRTAVVIKVPVLQDVMLFCVVFRVQLLLCPEDRKQQFLRNEQPDYTTSRHRRPNYLESICFDERNVSVTCIFLWCFSVHFSSHQIIIFFMQYLIPDNSICDGGSCFPSALVCHSHTFTQKIENAQGCCV